MEYSVRFRLYPTAEQQQQMAQMFGCVRFVYNHYRALREEQYQKTGKSYGYNECSKDLTSLKKQLPWLKDADATALQSSLRDLDAAYRNFFRGCKADKRVGYPRFKSRHDTRQSLKAKSNGSTIYLADKHIRLPKLGLVPCRISKQVDGRILSATVTREPTGKYFVAICYADVDIEQLPSTGAVAGVDLDTRNLAVTSDGKRFDNPKSTYRNERRLARLQRQLSRKTRGSKNCEQARVKVARLHEKIANQRKDSIHKMTTVLMRSFDVICMEDLNVAGMVKNHHLAKTVEDASFGEIRRQESMNLSDPYMKNEMIFVVPRGSDARNANDLKGKTVGVQSGSTARDVLESAEIAKDITIVAFQDNVKLLEQLEQGGLDAALLDSMVAYYFLSTSDESPFFVLPDSLSEEKFAIGFRKNDRALRDKVQEVLNEMIADGTLGNISEEWFGTDITIVK